MEQQNIVAIVDSFIQSLPKHIAHTKVRITGEEGAAVKIEIEAMPATEEERQRLLDVGFKYRPALELNYDKHADVLYITSPKNRPAYGQDTCGGFVWRRAVDNGELVGLTCINFKQGWADLLPRVHKLLCEKFPDYQVPSVDSIEKLLEI